MIADSASASIWLAAPPLGWRYIFWIGTRLLLSQSRRYSASRQVLPPQTVQSFSTAAPIAESAGPRRRSLQQRRRFEYSAERHFPGDVTYPPHRWTRPSCDHVVRARELVFRQPSGGPAREPQFLALNCHCTASKRTQRRSRCRDPRVRAFVSVPRARAVAAGRRALENGRRSVEGRTVMGMPERFVILAFGRESQQPA
jgi:hypothetical protein